jgi:pimeloyl-ACP methyl ester carboxylesterase
MWLGALSRRDEGGVSTFLNNILALLALTTCLVAQNAQAQTHVETGLSSGVAFSQYSPLASNAELARRLLSPLAAARMQAIFTRSGKTLTGQPIDLAKERFLTYVPSRAPPGGYGLLVFVPPWGQAKLPDGWASVLDRYGVIFVSADHSGNDDNVVARRIPLAVTAAANIIARYKVDPSRVWVGGFSGGAKVALRVALAWPDLFAGALLNGGSDPIGGGAVPLPPRPLFDRFQASARLVYVTGELDSAAAPEDANSSQSLRQWCVLDVASIAMPRLGHAAADSAGLSRTLEMLVNKAYPDPNRLAACRSGVETRLAARLQEAEALVSGGRREEAKKALTDIDRHYGGLAAPPILDLAQKCQCGADSP